MRPTKSGGFTLIEVLIAGVILFAVVTLISVSFRSALLSSEKASKNLQLLSSVPMITNTIKFRLQENGANGSITQTGVLDDLTFTWSANILKSGAPPARFSFDDGAVISFRDKFYLWEVNLEITNGETKRELRYEELTWLTR